MSNKTIRCFKYSVKNNNVEVDPIFLQNIVDSIFEGKDTKILSNGNKVRILDSNDDENYLSLEYLKTVTGYENEIPTTLNIDSNYIFFRIGRAKDIEGAMKRNLETWEGSEIIEKDKQGSYNLEICTYILIDVKNGIILEVFGQYAPTVRCLKTIINSSICRLSSIDLRLKNITFDYYNIMSSDLVEALSSDGERLGKISYKYANPNLEFLKILGLTPEEINVINEAGVFEVEVQLKGKARVPLTRNSDVIKKIISTFKKSTQKVKDNISFKGKTSTTSSKNYTFKEEEVTYKVDLATTKKVDNEIIRLDLNELAFNIYKSLKDVYTKNKESIKSYLN